MSSMSAQFQPGEVATRPFQALDKALFDQIIRHPEHDGDGASRLLGGQRGGRARPEDVRREPDQFGGEGGEPVAFPFSITVCDDDVVSLHVAELA